MECHSCPHNGKFAGVAFALTPCASCKLDETERPGRRRYDDAVAPCVRYGAERFATPAVPSPGSSDMPVAVLARAIGLLLALPPGDYELVRARYFGETCPEIAERLGLGKDAVLYRLRKILRANPSLKHLVPVRARFGRKPKSVSL